MQLDGLIGDQTSGAHCGNLGGGKDAAALVAVRGIGDAGSEDRHGRGLIQLDAHVDHAVLQGLELADHLAELLARLQVVEGQGAGRFHAANRFGALCGDRPALLVTQGRQGLAFWAEQVGGADEYVIQIQLASLAPILGRIAAALHADGRRIEQKQADAGFVTRCATGARADQDQPGALSTDQHGLAAAEFPAAAHRLGTGLHVVQLVVAGRLVDGDSQLQLRAGDLRQQIVLLRLAAQLRQQTAGIDHRVQVGLQAQATAQLGHDQHGFNATAAEAAVLLGERYGGQAQLTELLPEGGAEARFALAKLLALLEAIGVAHQARRGVLQHLLLFGKIEVHDRNAPYSSRIILAMMFFWISLEPP
ncbi:hypothetical protein D3C76_1019870 [compost metagenome]